MYMMGRSRRLRAGSSRSPSCTPRCLGEPPRPPDHLGLGVDRQGPRAERPPSATRHHRAVLLLPGPRPRPYWENILAKVNAVIEIPRDHWDWRPLLRRRSARTRQDVSKWGGFMDDVRFDPLKFGITPNSMPYIERCNCCAGSRAPGAADAGYLTGRSRETTWSSSASAAASPPSAEYAFRGVPLSGLLGDGAGDAMRQLPEWTEDSFPGILLNVAAGRVANRFNLGGNNWRSTPPAARRWPPCTPGSAS